MKKYITKQFSSKNKNLRYDFLPPMLEIIERPANPMGVFLIWLVVFIVLTTLVWAYSFKLDIVVTANGYVTPEDNLVAMQSENTGMIEEIFVEDSQMVEKDGPILSIRQTLQEMNLEELEYDLKLLQVQQDVYIAMHDGKTRDDMDLSAYGEHSQIAEAIIVEQELYLSRLKEYERVAKTEGQEGKNLKEAFEIENELSILQNINSLQVKIHDTETNIASAKEQMKETVVKAPVSGKITQLAYKNSGTFIASGENIAYIIPEDAKMLFKVYMPNRDINDIHVDDQVKVKLVLFDDTEDEIINGIVRKISDVAVSVQGLGNVYMVDVELEKTDELINYVGAEGACDIIVGERSVLDYFLEPFRKGLKDSLKEE